MRGKSWIKKAIGKHKGTRTWWFGTCQAWPHCQKKKKERETAGEACPKDNTRGMAEQFLVKDVTHGLQSTISAEAWNRDAIISVVTLPVWTKGGAEKAGQNEGSYYLGWILQDGTIEFFGCAHALPFKREGWPQSSFRDHQGYQLSFNRPNDLCLTWGCDPA